MYCMVLAGGVSCRLVCVEKGGLKAYQLAMVTCFWTLSSKACKIPSVKWKVPCKP
jgi:hypothetical protein